MKFAIARRGLEDEGLWGCGTGALALELKEIPGDAADGLHSVIAIKPIHPAFAKEEDTDDIRPRGSPNQGNIAVALKGKAMLVDNPSVLWSWKSCPHKFLKFIMAHVKEHRLALIGCNGITKGFNQQPVPLGAIVDGGKGAPHISRGTLQVGIRVRLPVGALIACGGYLGKLHLG